MSSLQSPCGDMVMEKKVYGVGVEGGTLYSLAHKNTKIYFFLPPQNICTIANGKKKGGGGRGWGGEKGVLTITIASLKGAFVLLGLGLRLCDCSSMSNSDC